MKKNYVILISGAIFVGISLVLNSSNLFNSNRQEGNMIIPLPEPKIKGGYSLEECLQGRRSIRAYQSAPLSLDEISQLLWAAQGITAGERYRTVPSAGATYPLEVYLIAGHVTGLRAGVYYYRSNEHSLELKIQGDWRETLSDGSLGQSSVAEAPASILITGVASRVTGKYEERGRNYMYMEAGHAGQNIYLQAYALGCGTVAVGAFDNDKIKESLKLPADQEPLYVYPVGKR
jgi:SagB-type dehydrogenase family enzyme